MATLAFTSLKNKETPNQSLPFYTLTTSDELTMPTTGNAFILIENSTGGDLTVTMTGEGVPVTVTFDGYGSAQFNALEVAVVNGQQQVVWLNQYANLLKGTVTLTGGENLKASLFTA